MTAYQMWNLRCDRDIALPESEDTYCSAGLDDQTAASASEAKKNGREEGWHRVRLKTGFFADLCPDCFRAFAATQEKA